MERLHNTDPRFRYWRAPEKSLFFYENPKHDWCVYKDLFFYVFRFQATKTLHRVSDHNYCNLDQPLQ